MINNTIKKAIALCGSQRALAAKIGITQGAVAFWLQGGGISAEYIKAIIEATNGEITYEEICEELAEIAQYKKSLSKGRCNATQ